MLPHVVRVVCAICEDAHAIRKQVRHMSLTYTADTSYGVQNLEISTDYRKHINLYVLTTKTLSKTYYMLWNCIC